MSLVDFFGGMQMGMRIAAQRVIKAAIASMYLYGTPSDSGNIGLRSGETVTYYDGAVLPKLPEWDKTVYPYAYIYYDKIFTNYVLCVAENPVKVEVSPYDSFDYRWYYGVETKYQQYRSKTDSVEWFFYLESTFGNVSGQGFVKGEAYDVLWANHDVVNTDDGTVYAPASDPIPVYTGMVGYSYNGTVLPGLPVWDKSKYPYAYISYYITGDTYYFYVLSKPLNYTRYSTVISGTYYGESEGVWLHGTSYMKCALNKADFEWGVLNTSSATAECHVNTSGERLSTMIWANYNMINGFDGGSVYLAKSDPVPVYE